MGYERECRQMILIDSIVFNQDRHLGNFGFIVDNETFEIKRFAPLFDYNSSFLCNAMPEDIKSVNAFKKYEKEYRFGHKLGGTFADIGRNILTPDLKNILPKNIHVPEHDKYNLDKERLNKIMDIMEYNLTLITESKLYHIDYLPEAAIDCKKENILKKSEKKIKEYASMDAKNKEYKKKFNCEYMDIND